MSALQRLKKEEKELQEAEENEDVPYSAQPEPDDPYEWQGTINGPANTPYEDGVFFLSIKFPQDYPFKPPKIKFQIKYIIVILMNKVNYV